MTKKTLKEIATLIPNGLSEEGLEEISSLLEAHVEQEVTGKVAKMEVQIASLFRTKLDNLKEVAYKELMHENANVKAIKCFDSIMGIVGEYVETEMIDSRLVKKDEVIKEQVEAIATLEKQMDDMLLENTRLSQALQLLTESEEELNEKLITTLALVDEQDAILSESFESSEKAFVIANDNSTSDLTGKLASAENEFLTEEMVSFTGKVLL